MTIVLALFLAASGARAQEMHDFAEAKKIIPPATLPALDIARLGGGKLDLHQGGAKLLVLNFWATWCPPCVAELPSLDRLAADNPDIAVIAVSNDHGGEAQVQGFIADHHISHAVIGLDPHGDAARALGVDGLPTTYVIDKQGQVCAQLSGPSLWDKQAAAIKKQCG